MTPNVGTIERMVRVIVGLTLVVLVLAGVIGWWGWLGLFPLVTGLVGWCPPYAMLGINTRKPAANDTPA